MAGPAPGPDEDGLPAELRGQLRRWCRDQGLLGELRAFLRHRLVTLVGGGGGAPSAGPSPPLALLAADLLRHLRLWFALAVLTAEAGLTRPGPPEARLSAAEVDSVLRECGRGGGERLFDRYWASDQPLVALLVQREQPSRPQPQPAAGPQPQPPPPPRDPVGPPESGPLELRMLQYRRKADAKAQQWYERELTAFKNDQLKEVEERERERYRKELAEMREELRRKYEIELEFERRKIAVEREAILSGLSVEQERLRRDNDRLHTLDRTIKSRELLLDLSAANQSSRGCQTVSKSFCDETSQTDVSAGVGCANTFSPQRAKLNVTFDAGGDDYDIINGPASSETLHHSVLQEMSPPVSLRRSGLSRDPGGNMVWSGCRSGTGLPHPSPGHRSGDMTSAQPRKALPFSTEQLKSPSIISVPRESHSASVAGGRLTIPSSRSHDPKTRLISELERRVAELEVTLSASRSDSQFSSPDRQRPAAAPPAVCAACRDGGDAALRQENAQCRAALERQRLVLEALMERSSDLEAQMQALQLMAEQDRGGHDAGVAERPLATSTHPTPGPPPPPPPELLVKPASVDQEAEMTALLASTRSRLGALSATASRLSRQYRDHQAARQRDEMDRALGGVKRQLFGGDGSRVSPRPAERDDRLPTEAGSAGRRRTWFEAPEAASLSREERIEAVLRKSRLVAASNSSSGEVERQARDQLDTSATLESLPGMSSLESRLRSTRQSSGFGSDEHRSTQRFSLGNGTASKRLPLPTRPVRDMPGLPNIPEHTPAPVSRPAATAVWAGSASPIVDSPSAAATRGPHTTSPSRSRLFSLLNSRATAVETADDDEAAVRSNRTNQQERVATRDSRPVRQDGDKADRAQANRTETDLSWENAAVRLSSTLQSVVESLEAAPDLDSQWRKSANGKERGFQLSEEIPKASPGTIQAVVDRTPEHRRTLAMADAAMTGDGEGSQPPARKHPQPSQAVDRKFFRFADSQQRYDEALDSQRKASVDLDFQQKPGVEVESQLKPSLDLDAQWKPSVDLDSQWKPKVHLDSQWKPEVDLDARWKPKVDLDAQWKPEADASSQERTADDGSRPSAAAGSSSSGKVSAPAAVPAEPSSPGQQRASPPDTSAAVSPAAADLDSDWRRRTAAAVAAETEYTTGAAQADSDAGDALLPERTSDDGDPAPAPRRPSPPELPSRPRSSASSAGSAEHSGALLRSSLGYAVSPAAAATGDGAGGFPLPTGEVPLPTGEFPLPTGEFPLPTGEFPLPAGEFPLPASETPRAVTPEAETESRPGAAPLCDRAGQGAAVREANQPPVSPGSPPGPTEGSSSEAISGAAGGGSAEEDDFWG